MTDNKTFKEVKATFIYYENETMNFKTVYGTLEYCENEFEEFHKKHPNSTWVWQDKK